MRKIDNNVIKKEKFGMLKNKFAIILLTVVMLFCVVIVSGCGNKNLMEDGEYNAVLVAQDRFTSSWPTNIKVEIKNNKLYLEDEEAGELSLGQVSQDDWGYPGYPDDFGIDYLNVVDGVDLDSLMSVKNCFVIDSINIFLGANYFYLILSNNNYYLLCAMKSEEGPLIGTWIFRVYLLDEICEENEA